MPEFISNSPLASRLIRIGNEATVKQNDAMLRDYCTDDYVLHSPSGEMDREQLIAYFASLRTAFTDFQLVREQVIVDGDHVASRNIFSGVFTQALTQSVVGPLEPNWKKVVWEAIQTCRYDRTGRLAEEWVQTDQRILLQQLQANRS